MAADNIFQLDIINVQYENVKWWTLDIFNTIQRVGTKAEWYINLVYLQLFVKVTAPITVLLLIVYRVWYCI